MRPAGRAAILLLMLPGQLLVAAAFAQSPDDSHVLCKREEVTSTHLPPPRTCRTVAQWRALDKQRQRERSADGQTFLRQPIEVQPPRPAQGQ